MANHENDSTVERLISFRDVTLGATAMVVLSIAMRGQPALPFWLDLLCYGLQLIAVIAASVATNAFLKQCEKKHPNDPVGLNRCKMTCWLFFVMLFLLFTALVYILCHILEN